MRFEAAWTPEGAVLLNRTRYSHTLKQVQQECPEKQQTMLHKTNEFVNSSDIFALEPEALILNHLVVK